MNNNEVLDIIIELIKGTKDKNDTLECTYKSKEYSLGDTKYLLGQVVRQYRIPDDHHYISKAAQNLCKRSIICTC